MDITLYQFPGACSRVTMNALEELGLRFDDILVNLRNMDQKTSEYLAVNPRGKVPTVRFGRDVLTENAAILWTLHSLHPSGGLFPAVADPIGSHRFRADLAWCSGTLHPIVRQIRMPQKWTIGAPEDVRAHGVETLLDECATLSARIDGGWWYGEAWSIIDTYIYWGYSTAEKGGFPLDRFPVLMAHAERVRARPSFQRTLERERAALERSGIEGVQL